MLSRIAAWSSKRNAEREESEFEDIVEELSGIPNLKLRRKWSERKLHDELAADRISKADRTILESELRRREAWQFQPVKPSGYRLPLWDFLSHRWRSHSFAAECYHDLWAHVAQFDHRKKSPRRCEGPSRERLYRKSSFGSRRPEYCPPSRTTIDECVDVRI